MLAYQFRSPKKRPEHRPARHSVQIVEDFEWDNALVVEDLRKDYGERRFQALGLIAGRLHALVFTPRAGLVHVISLRKANRREIKLYEAQTN